MSQTPCILLENLTHSYGERVALQGVGFSIYEGELFGVLGPNGGGKTTLFRILSTLIPPTRGNASILGFDVASQPHEVRSRIGVVFQSPSIDVKLTVEENLKQHGRLHGIRGHELHERTAELLKRFGIADRRGDSAEKLSGGLQRRVELAKGLLHRPRVLLLDEPSTGLDPGVRRDLWSLLQDLRSREGVTVVVTTHLLEEAEKCDRLAILHQGKLIALGTPDGLKSKIGGEVLMVRSPQMDELRKALAEKFGLTAIQVDGFLRIEKTGGHEIVSLMMASFPHLIDSITVGKPSLEDVFIKETGHKFWHEVEN